MSTDTDTRRVLDLLAQGKITVEEAHKLIDALAAASAPPSDGPSAGAPAAGRPSPRWVRINIVKPAKDGKQDKEMNIRVPIAVVKGGMRLGAIIGTFAGEKAALKMKAQGIDLNLPQIKSDFSKMNGEEFDAFMKALDDVNIDIDDGKSQVRITCE